MPKGKTKLQRRIDRLTWEKYALSRMIEQLLRELKKKGRQPGTVTARKGTYNEPKLYHTPACQSQDDYSRTPQTVLPKTLETLGC